MVSAAPKREESSFARRWTLGGTWRVHRAKSSAAGKSGARSVSSSRLVGTEATKAAEVGRRNQSHVAPHPPPPSPPPSARRRRFPKARTSSIAARRRARASPGSVRTAAARKTRTRSGSQQERAQGAVRQAVRCDRADRRLQARRSNKSFFDIGVLLNQIRNERLYEVKGYGSFESFVEREVGYQQGALLADRARRRSHSPRSSAGRGARAFGRGRGRTRWRERAGGRVSSGR